MDKKNSIYIYNIPRTDAMGIVISDTKENACNKVIKQLPQFINGPTMSDSEIIEVVSWEEQEELEGCFLDDVLELIY